MAMFGSALKKPNPFGIDEAGQSLVTGAQRPMDMGDFGPAPPVESGGLLRQGSPGQAALGAFLDGIATQTGGQAQFAPQMQRRQDRENALADWQAKFAFQQANKAPREGTSLEQNAAYYRRIGRPDLASQLEENTASGPPVAVDVAAPDGSVTRQFLPRNSMGGQQGGGDTAVAGGGMPSWWNALPEEQRAVIERHGRGLSGDNVPMGSPLKGNAPPKVASAADYEALPAGAAFYDPQGNLRTKGGR